MNESMSAQLIWILESLVTPLAPKLSLRHVGIHVSIEVTYENRGVNLSIEWSKNNKMQGFGEHLGDFRNLSNC